MMGRSNKFHGKLVLITGGSKGIGLALAEKFVVGGANVWLLARRKQYLETSLDKLFQLSSSNKQQHGFVICDISKYEEVETAVNEVILEAGIPDILVNSAGVVHPGDFLELNINHFHWMMDVNYFGIVHILRVLLPSMLERGSGYIVNIASMAAVIGIYGYSAYSPSKSAVLSFSQALRTELRPTGISVSVVLPTDTDTDQLQYEVGYRPPETKVIAALGSVNSPESVAENIIKGISRDKFLILPSFDAKLLYWAEKILGNKLLNIFDLLISWSRD